MRIEAFSAGKNPAQPDANEDRFVVLPGRAYAVIDGVTDRTGIFYEGRSSGRIAAERVQAALERIVADAPAPGPEPALLLAAVSAEIGVAYDLFGMRETARGQPNQRFGATLALFRHRGDFDEVLLVGDSGIRLDGTRVIQIDKPLDAITASLRVAAWRDLERRGHDSATCNRIGRQIVFHGAAQGLDGLEGLFDAASLAVVAARAVAESAARFPDLPREAIARLVAGGIVNDQFDHQNNPASALGYSGVDGFPIPAALVTVLRLKPGTTHRIELFTDGYFSRGDGFGVACWEAAADTVERVDPERLGPYASVKGSLGDIRADDRTYLGIAEG